MIQNQIDENGVVFRVNFNLNKKHDSDKWQILLITTIKRKRVRLFTGLRINPKHWKYSNYKDEGEQAIESTQWGPEIFNESKRINTRLLEILEACRKYARLVSNNNLDETANLEFSSTTFREYMTSFFRGEEAQFRKDPEKFISEFIEAKSKDINEDTGALLKSGSIFNHWNALHRLKNYCNDEKKQLKWELFDDSFIPSKTIMAITGHKTESNFMKYIKISQKEHAAEMAEHWKNG